MNDVLKKPDGSIYNPKIPRYEREVKYTTAETKTGKFWIDGKPIYRRVMQNYFSEVYNSWFKIGTISNLETLIGINGSLKQKVDGSWLNFPRATSASSDTSQDFYINSSTGAVNIRIHNGTGQLYLVLEYTKTTD